MPGFGEAVCAGGVGVPDLAPVDIGLAHLPANGVEVGLVFGPDLLGEGVRGVVGGGAAMSARRSGPPKSIFIPCSLPRLPVRTFSSCCGSVPAGPRELSGSRRCAAGS